MLLGNGLAMKNFGPLAHTIETRTKSFGSPEVTITKVAITKRFGPLEAAITKSFRSLAMITKSFGSLDVTATKSSGSLAHTIRATMTIESFGSFAHTIKLGVKLMIPSYPLCLLRTAESQLQLTVCLLRTAECQLQFTSVPVQVRQCNLVEALCSRSKSRTVHSSQIPSCLTNEKWVSAGASVVRR